MSGSLTYSEVGCCQGVCGTAILADDGCCVSQLTVVLTSASNAGYFTDGGCKDHLDPPCMVAHCCRKYDTDHKDREGEET